MGDLVSWHPAVGFADVLSSRGYPATPDAFGFEHLY